MSGILGVFTSDQRASPDPVALDHMLDALSVRGEGLTATWRAPGTALAVARNSWELHEDFSGDALVVRDRGLAIVADASLYYRDDLCAKLGVPKDTPSRLILAAYRAWGERCVDHLEGDYAFILWDAETGRLFCARDFAGSRPLFYGAIGHTLIVGSTLSALRAHPETPAAFNEAFLAETAASLWLPADDTAYRGLSALPAGCSLSWSRAQRWSPIVSRHWNPPAIDSRSAPSAREAAAELRHRLRRAVRERLGTHTTSVWMSGGRDSTAVFAAGRDVLASRRNGQRLYPISMSFPSGHGGREDEFIESVAQRWNSPIHWLDGAQIPLFADPVQRAARRDEPYDPLFAMTTRVLARGSRAAGARIAFDGWGGDQLFELSPVYLADLFRSGRWISLARAWRALGVSDTRYLARTIAPAVPRWLRGAATLLRHGRPLPEQHQRWMPPWINARLLPALKQRQLEHLPPRRRGSFANHELHVSLTAATASRVRGWVNGLALDEGVEIRSPLFDARIIALAVTRPAAERRAGRDTKLLLRKAMEGLIPGEVLAPRRRRTGVVGECFKSGMRADYARLLHAVIDSSVLADLGIIDPVTLRRAAADCLSHAWNDDVASALFCTLQTELWLRTHVGLDVPDDGRLLAVLPPGKRPGHIQYLGGGTCIPHRSSSASALSGISR